VNFEREILVEGKLKTSDCGAKVRTRRKAEVKRNDFLGILKVGNSKKGPRLSRPEDRKITEEVFGSPRGGTYMLRCQNSKQDRNVTSWKMSKPR